MLKGALIICANDKALRSIYRGHHRASNSNQRVTQWFENVIDIKKAWEHIRRVFSSNYFSFLHHYRKAQRKCEVICTQITQEVNQSAFLGVYQETHTLLNW